MRPLKYFIGGSNAWKQGYDYGCVSRARFMVESTKEGRKQTEFVNDYVEEIIKNDKDRINGEIGKLKAEINKNNEEIEKFEEKKNVELTKIEDKYKEDMEDSKLKKSEIERDFSRISSDILSNMTQANTIIKGLVDKLNVYVSESEKYWNNQTKKIGDEWKNFSISSKKIVSNNIKDILLNGIDKTIIGGDKRVYRKDFCAMFFFLLLCIYDFYFGKDAINSALDTDNNLLIGFLAVCFVPIVIGSVHFAAKTLGGKATNQRQLGILTILSIFVIVLLYVGQSLPLNVREAIPNAFIKSLLGVNALTLIFRLFMLPSMFIGEIIIETTNRDNIFHYFGKIGKKFSVVTHLVRNGLTALKMRSLSKWLREEKKAITENINNIKAESTPDFSLIKQDITKIQSLINPIYSKVGDEGVYKMKLNEAEDKIKALEAKYKEDIDEIDKKFKDETKEMGEINDKNQRIIDNYYKKLSVLESHTKEGFLRGLTGK